MLTAERTVMRVGRSFIWRDTNSQALPKQAAYPAANRSSGVVVLGLPGPPIAFGMDRSTLTSPSADWVWPLRPPTEVACAV